DHGVAYVIEGDAVSRIVRVDLASGSVSNVVSDIHNGIGLLITADMRFAYVTEQLPNDNGLLSRVELRTGKKTAVFKSTESSLFMMSWSDPDQKGIYVTERDPANSLWFIDLMGGSARRVATGLPSRPSSVAVIASGELL